jgi:hypothetical protein
VIIKGKVKKTKNHISSFVRLLFLCISIERKKEMPKESALRKKEKNDNGRERKKK